VKFLLDTNVVSELMKGEPEGSVASWFKKFQPDCFLSAVTVAEIELGIELLPAGRRKQRLAEAFSCFFPEFNDRVLPFDLHVARRWAKLASELERLGRKTPVQDSMIEATAIEWNLAVATRNERDFVQAATLNPWTARL
jgi:predicted nucleic acid-binding protein